MATDIIANKYKIVREIARSNDVVYEAIDTTMGRRLAVKELCLPPNLTGQAKRERIERFNREARAAGKLTHPNIVTVYDFGEHDSRHFIAMEYLEGATLRDAIQTRGALPLKEALDVANQVLSGLAHAHSRQVVHRDVKPDNIHILPGGIVKLADFGIARLTEEASLTGEGQVFGTPSYMSPEQIEGRFIDHRSDLFSLGIVLYEMLTGRKPFTGDSVVSITYAIMHAEPAPMAGIPYGVEQTVLRALQKDPARRFGSAEEMRLALKNAEAAPSMFFQRQPTSMGTGMLPPQPGGPLLPAPGYINPPAVPPGYGPPVQYGQAVPPTVYSPPPQPAAPPAAGAGPFVNWSAGAQSPPPAVGLPPAIPRRAGMSEGAKTFLVGLTIAIVLSCLVIGFVLLFVRAYEQQRELGTEQAVERINAEGKRLYDAGNLAAAAQRFQGAMAAGPGTKAASDARTNLAITLNQLGLRAYQSGDLRNAEAFWNQALDIDPGNADVHYNLGQLYNRIGDRDRALQEWQFSADANRAGSPNPAAPGNPTSLQARYERAKVYLNQGTEAYNTGNTQLARDNWQKAVGEAPGTDVAMRAQDYLDRTASAPNF